MKDGGVKNDGLFWSGAFAAALLLTSWVSRPLLTLFVALAAAAVSFVLAKRLVGPSPATGPLAAALGAGSFPIWIWARGEPGVLWAGASVVLFVALVLLFSRPPGDAVKVAAVLVWLPFLIGFGLSYSVLIKREAQGQRLLLCVCLILLAYKGSAVVATAPRFAAESPVQRITLSVRLAGIAAAEVAAMVSLLFLEEPVDAGPLAMLGIMGGLAAMLGEASARSITSEPSLRPSEGRLSPPLMSAVDAWLVALPAFFYGFRLYLT